MLIAEELYLLLTKDLGTQESPGTQRGYGLTAALIADLVLAERVVLTEEQPPHLIVVSSSPTGHPVLDAGLAQLAGRNGKRLDQLVTWSKLDPEETVVASLVKQGVLAYGDRTFFGMGKPRTPEQDPEPERRTRTRLTAVLAGTAAPTAADATLLSVLQGLGVARYILKAESNGMRGQELKTRIDAVVEHSPTGEAVDRAVQALNAAIMAAAAVIPAIAVGGA
ncbi:GPP34 family phosphoprotein [Leucobacter sp. wl10]|uniref:GOLPH3/VPS74 family protein n=1 Tax=Leucobacter sp. wl10 TaxID=2304677 RepID=UPI0013C355CD|nr:GPP34 family phosphoprotein [Leucobacter sp. wl10]